MKSIIKYLLFLYETRIAPFIAIYLRIFLWPFYLLCKKYNYCFLINIASSPGHTTVELDHFLRKLHLQIIPINKRYIWIMPGTKIAKTYVKYHKSHFWYACSNYLIYELILPMTIGFKDITIDCGLSRMKFQLNKDNKYDKPTYPNTYLYQISKNDWNKSWLNCYKLEKNTPNYFPLISQKSHDLSLLNQLNIQPQKIALIHIKTLAINATAKITDPKTYGPALAFLVKKGYQLVFIGREIMPEYFKQYPIVNYSESKYASFINDMKLFAMADLSITAGSGIFCLANYFNKPLLYINYWHLMTPPSGKKVINIPTTVKNKANKDLTFIEQIQLFNDLSKHGADLFPEDQYIARNASSTEILEGVKELLNLSPQLTPLQLQFQTLDKTSPKYYARSRCSEYFLKTHSHLFENA